MFFYFPGNYMWSLGVNRCLAAGGHFGEINWALQGLQAAAKAPPQGDSEAWYAAWLKLAHQTAAIGEEAESKGHRITASSQFYRAAQYYQWAEAFLDPDDERASPTYGLHLKSFDRFALHAPSRVEVVDVPFGSTTLSAYFVPARGTTDRSPAVILWDGLDGTKEEMFPMASHLAARGISCLGIDITGQGASLRLNGLKARHDTEVCATAAYEWLSARPEVDASRVGLIGASMGGYSAPRAVAYEKRIKACVAWGAIYDYHDVWVRRLNSIGRGATLDYGQALGTTGKHLLNIVGATDFDEALKLLEPFHLREAALLISCDILLVHGEHDRQTSLENAKALFAAIGSKNKQMRVYTAEEGGAAHVQLDRQEPAASLIADWFTDHL
ncbi:alpha/beta hydrolase [Bradyrhizobium sp. NP1]|uniref:alpha/beta hydrolase family protein n=1 Tax=Bradyrhizobium sp. NP1 TaxID=3049772 RepID=UPI0025A5BA00|nr:alpha/beta hydrolase [Bradyrhizobium sp. NP1]WJR79818.1 alpha/beta hydrolase [Bradyrhizobium sp. NP1]